MGIYVQKRRTRRQRRPAALGVRDSPMGTYFFRNVAIPIATQIAVASTTITSKRRIMINSALPCARGSSRPCPSDSRAAESTGAGKARSTMSRIGRRTAAISYSTAGPLRSATSGSRRLEIAARAARPRRACTPSSLEIRDDRRCFAATPFRAIPARKPHQQGAYRPAMVDQYF